MKQAILRKGLSEDIIANKERKRPASDLAGWCAVKVCIKVSIKGEEPKRTKKNKNKKIERHRDVFYYINTHCFSALQNNLDCASP